MLRYILGMQLTRTAVRSSDRTVRVWDRVRVRSQGSGSGVIHRTQAESRIWGTLQTFIEIYNRLWTHPNVRSGSGSGSGSVFLNIVSFLF